MTRPPMLVLAGGFGTRLRAAVGSVPKALAPAGGAPFLRHLLENWIGQGVKEFVFALHHEAELIQRFLEQEQARGVLRDCVTRSVVESVPLGTGGAIANVVRETGLNDSFLVANADTWLGGGVRDVASASTPAVAVVQVPNTSRYGAVQVEGDAIDAFVEKSNSSGPGWINAGLYHLAAESFMSWNGVAFSLETGFFPAWVQSGALRAVTVKADFIDIGIPEDYHRFCRWAEADKAGAL